MPTHGSRWRCCTSILPARSKPSRIARPCTPSTPLPFTISSSVRACSLEISSLPVSAISSWGFAVAGREGLMDSLMMSGTSSGVSAPVAVATGSPGESPRLLHITHARQDEAWVQEVLIPALGLIEGQYWTRAEDDLGALRLEELERAVRACR